METEKEWNELWWAIAALVAYACFCG